MILRRKDEEAPKDDAATAKVCGVLRQAKDARKVICEQVQLQSAEDTTSRTYLRAHDAARRTKIYCFGEWVDRAGKARKLNVPEAIESGALEAPKSIASRAKVEDS